MELNNTFQNEIITDLNALIDEILLDGSMSADIQHMFLDNPNCLENCTSTRIAERKLCALIELAKKDRNVGWQLCSVVDQIDDSSITHEVFRLLFTFPQISTRNNILVSLCHKVLPVDMLEQLCNTNICFESYFSLICTLYQEESASCAQLRTAIELFLHSPFYYMAEELYQEITWLKNDNLKRCLSWEMLVKTIELQRTDEPVELSSE